MAIILNMVVAVAVTAMLLHLASDVDSIITAGRVGNSKFLSPRIHTVGDSKFWSASADMKVWSRSNQFLINDVLEFIYNDTHTVVEVGKHAYDKCIASEPIDVHGGGTTRIKLLTHGDRYFISGVEELCKDGLKLHVITQPNRDTPGIAFGRQDSPHTTHTKLVTEIEDVGSSLQLTVNSIGNLSQLIDKLTDNLTQLIWHVLLTCVIFFATTFLVVWGILHKVEHLLKTTHAPALGVSA